MDINTAQQLNINQTTVAQSKTSVQSRLDAKDTNFAEELIKAKSETQKEDTSENNSKDKSEEVKKSIPSNQTVKNEEKEEKKQTEQIDTAIDGLQDMVTEINKISQKDENTKIEDNDLIENNLNIRETADKINIQTETGTNFSNNGQPFAEFINKEQQTDGLKSTDKELAEERAILSTMEENIAIANKNKIIKEKAEKSEKIQSEKVQQNEPEHKNITIQNEEGIKKVDTKTNLTVETIVSYENVVMDKADADFFVNLVENGSVNLNEIQTSAKSAQVSKTLADLLAKAMNENKPVRIDFDNDISVIIKIDRTGKISADFLPSSQIAEAYLKENLPLLRQRFNDNNIDYNELNQRKQKQDTQDNRKKGRKDE